MCELYFLILTQALTYSPHSFVLLSIIRRSGTRHLKKAEGQIQCQRNHTLIKQVFRASYQVQSRLLVMVLNAQSESCCIVLVMPILMQQSIVPFKRPSSCVLAGSNLRPLRQWEITQRETAIQITPPNFLQTPYHENPDSGSEPKENGLLLWGTM